MIYLSISDRIWLAIVPVPILTHPNTYPCPDPLSKSDYFVQQFIYLIVYPVSGQNIISIWCNPTVFLFRGGSAGVPSCLAGYGLLPRYSRQVGNDL